MRIVGFFNLLKKTSSRRYVNATAAAAAAKVTPVLIEKKIRFLSLFASYIHLFYLLTCLLISTVNGKSVLMPNQKF